MTTANLIVSQEAREAAAAFWFSTVEATDENFAVGHHLRTGNADHNELVQAFARFEAETLERAAVVAIEEAHRHKNNSLGYESEEDGGDGSKEQCLVSSITCFDIATAIRNLKGTTG